jgi:hypothetical protein
MSLGRHAHHRPKRTTRAVLAGGALVAMTALAGTSIGTAHASLNPIIISEVAPWGSSFSYGADWFEATNTTGAAIDITGWKMDDNSNSFAVAVPLSGVTSIAAGESVIFIEVTGPTSSTVITNFKAAWFPGGAPSGLQIGTYSGSGVGLSATADAVNLFNAAGTLQANVSFGAATQFISFDNAAGINNAAISASSVAGTNGAFTVGATPETGSPGTTSNSPGTPVPEFPIAAVSSIAALGIVGGFLLISRRRRQVA